MQAQDRASGQSEIQSVRFSPIKPDVTSPEIVIIEPLLEQGNRFTSTESSIRFRGQVTDDGAVSAFTLNGTAIRLDERGQFDTEVTLALNQNEFELSAEDEAGNLAERTISIFREDVTPPEIVLVEPVLAQGDRFTSRASSIRFRGQVTDDGAVSAFTLNGTAIRLDERGQFDTEVTLTLDQNQVELSAEDAAGNLAERTISIFREDVTPPEIVLVEPVLAQGDRFTSRASSIRFRGQVTDDGTVSAFTLNGTAIRLDERGQFDTEVTLTLDQNQVELSAEDEAGNQAEQTISIFREDVTPPTIVIVEPVLTDGDRHTASTSRIRFRGQVTDDGTVGTFTLNGTVISLDETGIFDTEVTLNLDQNLFHLSATDAVGNTATDTITIIREDATPPQIVFIEPVLSEGNSYTARAPRIRFRGQVTDDESVDIFTINGAIISLNDIGQFETEVTLDLNQNLFLISASDLKGNTATTTISVFREDISPPEIVVFEPQILRGIKVKSRSPQIRFAGQIIDESPIQEFSINGVSVTLDADNRFDTDVSLVRNTNNVRLNAVDVAGNSKDELIEVERVPLLEITGKYYAFIVGVDDYSGEWPKLRNAVSDAAAVAEVLGSNYRFDDIKTMYNDEATRTEIYRQIQWYEENLTDDDLLLLYYSGHGVIKFDRGYWVPSDASTDLTAELIPNTEVQTWINGIPSKHTLLIADACFAGDLFRAGPGRMRSRDNTSDYYQTVFNAKSRKAFTSGGIEPVMDGGPRQGHSVFAYYLLQGLRNNTSDYIDAQELYDGLLYSVINNSEQTPEFNAIKNAGDEGGQFIFVAK